MAIIRKVYPVAGYENRTPRIRVIVRKPHFATFNEKHNSCKSKVLLILYHFKHTLQDNSGLDSRELYLHTGVNYSYLLARLPKWTEWKFIRRHSAIGTNEKPVWHYKIASRGEKFLTERLLPLNRPMYERYSREIKEFNSLVGQMNPPEFKYKSMKALIAAVNKEIVTKKRENEEA